MCVRMLINLRHLGFSDLRAVSTRYGLAARMHHQHNLHCFISRHLEELLQGFHYEVHGRVVIVVHDYFVQRWLFKLGAGLLNYKAVIGI